MIHEFNTKDMVDILCKDLSTIQDKEGVNTAISLTISDTNITFPCRIIDAPIEIINTTDRAIPILKTFQVNIEHWDSEPKKCIEMACNTDRKLQLRNFVRINSSQITLDEVTKKYKFITNYEVRYNALTNSFSYIK